MTSTQTRLSLARTLADHDQRPASSLVALQFGEAVTASATFPGGTADHRVDEVKANATGGAVVLTLPAGSKEIIGLPFIAVKTDSSANAVSLARAGTDTFAGGGTSISTTTQHGRVGAYWDGSNWRDLFANSAGSAASLALGSGSLTIGDGTGSTSIRQNKSNAGTAAYQLAVGSTLRGDLALDASENVVLNQRDNAGAVVGALSFNNSSGAASFSKALTIATGGLTISAGGLDVTGALIFRSVAEYADDAAAAVGLVPVGGVYRTASVLKVRVA